MEAEQTSSAAEQRAFAVAKLKRAASLPRMKDGRRPPMHVDGVSEGEKTPADGSESPSVVDVKVGRSEEEAREATANTSDTAEAKETPEVSETLEVAELSEHGRESAVTPDLIVRTKRRSRSRSRSRGSRDFKGKARATQSPTPSPLVQGNDSSAEDSPPPRPTDIIPPSPNLVSPIPSHFGVQPSRLLMSPRFISPDPTLFYPGTSPPTPAPMTPMLPTLEALQRGLFRSNSAAARMMAMHKLTGGTDTYEHLSPSPTPPPIPNQLGRSNTVSGGERSAARKMMLRRLGERIKEEHGDQTSGGEENFVAPPQSPKRRRRRSRRGSTGTSTAVDESDYPSTATNTPIVPSGPLPFTSDNLYHKTDPIPSVPSTTPSRTASAQEHARQRETTLLKLTGGDQSADYEPPRKRRSVVVEEEDDAYDDNSEPLPSPLGLPVTPDRLRQKSSRVPHSSDAPSVGSSDTAPGTPVPVYLSVVRSSIQSNSFPSSPFGTPLKEKRSQDEDEEQVLYQAENHRGRSPFHDAFDREISWVADPVPETRIPIQDDTEDDDVEENSHEEHTQLDHSLQTDVSHQSYRDTSPRNSANYKELVVETETSIEHDTSNVPPSPSSVAALSQTTSILRASDDSGSPQTYPTRLSVASRIQSDRSPLHTDFEVDDVRGIAAEPLLKRVDSTSTWERVKNTFSRSGSNGRRSRTNSIIKRDNTDSSISRESGASLGSGKTDKADMFASQQAQQPLQHSASTSVLSLAPHPAPRNSVSPIPPASTADLMKYKDSKLFPFPGMKKLEEQRNRSRGMSLSSSTPDILLAANGDDNAQHSSSSGTPAQTPDKGRERKLSHQASDSHLLTKYKSSNSPQISANPSTSSHTDYFNFTTNSAAQTAGSASLKLPTNREGVRRWLSAKKLFPSQVAALPSSSNSSTSIPVLDIRPEHTKKPSLSDVLLGRKDDDLTADWEDVGSDKSHTPTTTSASTLPGKPVTATTTKEHASYVPNGNGMVPSDNEKTPKAHKVVPHFNATSPRPYTADLSPALPSPPEQLTSTTPDPLSSLSDYPARSTSGSSSNTSSGYSQFHPNHTARSQGTVVLERLDEMLGRGLRSPMWASAIDDPPRKLLLSSPVLQVVNSNTVKDRFLFLFSDILVIAKPIVQDQDALMDTSKPNPMDRKFIVKSVVLLHHLRFSADREEVRKSSNNYGSSPSHPVMRNFVLQFAKDPDHAISSLYEKTGHRDDTATLGKLLFRSLELDRTQLGDYLSRRTSKTALKAYVDSFGFTGLRVDKALRVFLYSINIPKRTTHTYSYSPLDSLLDSFASRWYEANAGIVAYDKDLAFRLVRAIVQLNEVLHGGIADEPGVTGYPRRNVTSRDFLEAFRRYDGRGLATDELLGNIYDSIRRERLSQARNLLLGGPPDIPITIKRPPPARLTYRVQSEPIVLRIPQQDPQLNIHLYGQGLMFDPPVLSFAKSSEASFRITGTSLGSKIMILSRSGPNALLYTGLPQSCSVVVERAFMRNTFNLAFSNHDGVKRRYMFSVDDPLIRHQWTVSLKRQIDVSLSSTTANSTTPGTSKFHSAAVHTAFKVLQETLIGLEHSSGPPPASSIDKALDRLAMSPRTPYSPKDSHSVFAKEQRYDAQVNARNGTRDSHLRSKSRSKVYHKQGAGRLELDLTQSGSNSFESFGGEERWRGMSTIDRELDSRAEGKLWSARDLEMLCQQNSSIALVLAYLQVGAPDHDQPHS